MELISGRRAIGVFLLAMSVAAPSLHGEIDRSKYMFVDELRAGMTGYGRTVMSGSEIETFQFEIVSVMSNAWAPDQDVILVRCSGLNLEHSGIIGGMSGSPCYVEDGSGKARMIGAIAYGWTFNKDPLCGVQPIEQMLDVLKVRGPGKEQKQARGSDRNSDVVGVSGSGTSSSRRGAIPMEEIVAKSMDETAPQGSRFAIFNDAIRKEIAQRPERPQRDQLSPLQTPVMVSGLNPTAMERLRGPFARRGMVPVAGSGGAVPGLIENPEKVKLEPGSAICVPLMTGDLQMEALGTCTEVVDGRVLGFGHSFFAEGAVELPMATGMVHTVIPSVMRSNKLGAALRPVGVLYGDENTAISGTLGNTLEMVPFDVTIQDVRGERSYNYNLVQEWFFTSQLLGMATQQSIFAHSSPPRFHTIEYTVETTFKGLGTFSTKNISSQDAGLIAIFDTMMPVAAMMNSPYGEAELESAKLHVEIRKGASMATLVDMLIPKTTYKPGETVVFDTTWMHAMQEPVYRNARYEYVIPENVPDGTYKLLVGSAISQIRALQAERPHLFETRSLEELLAGLNLLGEYREDRLYFRMEMPGEGVAIGKMEMPDLPGFQRKILLQNKPSDIYSISNSHVATRDLDFIPRGQRIFAIKVQRHESS